MRQAVSFAASAAMHAGAAIKSYYSSRSSGDSVNVRTVTEREYKVSSGGSGWSKSKSKSSEGNHDWRGSHGDSKSDYGGGAWRDHSGRSNSRGDSSKSSGGVDASNNADHHGGKYPKGTDFGLDKATSDWLYDFEAENFVDPEVTFDYKNFVSGSKRLPDTMYKGINYKDLNILLHEAGSGYRLDSWGQFGALGIQVDHLQDGEWYYTQHLYRHAHRHPYKEYKDKVKATIEIALNKKVLDKEQDKVNEEISTLLKPIEGVDQAKVNPEIMNHLNSWINSAKVNNAAIDACKRELIKNLHPDHQKSNNDIIKTMQEGLEGGIKKAIEDLSGQALADYQRVVLEEAAKEAVGKEAEKQKGALKASQDELMRDKAAQDIKESAEKKAIWYHNKLVHEESVREKTKYFEDKEQEIVRDLGTDMIKDHLLDKVIYIGASILEKFPMTRLLGRSVKVAKTINDINTLGDDKLELIGRAIKLDKEKKEYCESIKELNDELHTAVEFCLTEGYI